MTRLQSKVALITGAGSGMGAAEAIIFAREGAAVIITDIDEDKGQTTLNAICKENGNAIFLKLDVTQEHAWQTVTNQAITAFGKIDILVNNAAIFLTKNLETTTAAEWDRIFEANTKSVFLGCKQVIPYMRENGGGAIVNVSSMFAFVGKADMAAYLTAKGAIKVFSKALAAEYALNHIRVNSLCPGFIETPMTANIQSTPIQYQDYLSRIPLNRPGTVQEVAQAALFLASDEASYITGTELIVDGGYTAV